MPPKQKTKTNPRDIVRQLREIFINNNNVDFEIRGAIGGELYMWEFKKKLPKASLSYEKITIYGEIPLDKKVIKNKPFENVLQNVLDVIDNQILDNSNLIITYIINGDNIRYDCRNDLDSLSPSENCYDLVRIPAVKIATAVKEALARPDTELGRRRIMRDFQQLSMDSPFANKFGKTKKRMPNLSLKMIESMERQLKNM